ncbi:MAG: hypothetical protein Q4E47_03875 [Candidatus Saccharibacteria bacterium]|nr:hypothetical protein [Candidatus Saccharibacteria bacterium]
MQDTNTNFKRIEELLEDPKFANLTESDEIPEEILKEMSGEELTLLFVEKMIEDAGVEANDEIRAKLYNELNDFVLAKIVLSLPESVAAKVSEEGADVNAIIAEAGVDVSKITEEAMVEFREKFLAQQKEEA